MLDSTCDARQLRLDGPGVLHHVMARGIEPRWLFASAVASEDLVARVRRHAGRAPARLEAGNRRPAARRAREGIAYLWTEVSAPPGRPLAPVLGVLPAAIYMAARRGGAEAAGWQRLLGKAI